MERNKIIIRTSVFGIITNIFLVIFKMIVGLLSGSIAIVLDAVNNLGDALSSILTIVGTKLAGRRPDKKHPYGYGRIEYMTSVVIAIIILVAGVTSLKESIEKVIHPTMANYGMASFLIIFVAIIVKILIGRYVKRVGEQINAQALVASGVDASFDAILSTATLIAALISRFAGITLEGILGAIIAIIIIKAGLEMLQETIDALVGVRTDPELSQEIKARIREFDGVKGAYDLALHNYGPMEVIGSVHVEVPDETTADQIHHLSKDIIAAIYKEYKILLTVGIYASNNTDGPIGHMMHEVEQIVKEHKEVLGFHGFYCDEAQKKISFDMVMNFKVDTNKVKTEILEELNEKYEGYCFDISLDTDFSD